MPVEERIHVEERGTGTPVVLIHGAGVDHRILLPLEPVFEESGGWRRLYVDLPGMGRSPVGDVASSDDMAEAVLREVRERLGDEPFALVGNSYGAMIARRLVAELPGQVLGLATVAGVFVATHARRTAPPRTVLHVEPGLLDDVDPAVAEGYAGIAVVQSREGLEAYERYVRPGILTVDAAGLEPLGAHYAFAVEPEDAAPPFTGPTLFLCGRQDDVVGYADAWARLEHYPRASLVVLDRAGHNVLVEQPEQSRAAVADWLARVRAAAPRGRPRGRLAIIGSGGGTTAARLIAAAADGTIPADVAVVVGNNSGAGIFAVARSAGIPAVHLSGRTHPDPDDLDRALLDVLERFDVELVVLAGYLKKLGPRVLARFDGAILNTHPALLPDYGGSGMYGDRVHAAVLADGRRTTGASVHLVTAEYDEGPVVAQVEVPVLPDDDVATLRERVQAAEKGLLVEAVARRFAR